MSDQACYVGIDIGGTTIKAGVVSADGTVLTNTIYPVCLDCGRDEGLIHLYAIIDRIIAESRSRERIAGIGLAAPGTMDIPAGVIFHPFNLPGWDNLPIVQLVSERFGLPAVLQNDANAAAMGEAWLGRARGVDSVMFWTLGTGIGGGIVLNGRVWEGAHSHAAECGHMIIQQEGGPRSEFGIHGSLELYAGARGLLRRCREALASGARSTLRDREAGGETITPIIIADEAKQGDELADRLIMETARYLAIGTVNIMHILNPAMVLFGGAMTFDQHGSELGRRFLAKVKEEVKARAFPIPAERTIIDYAVLGGDAGFIGAAACAMKAFS
ncbi:ROK family protein [Planctomyces sp. SH-PL14]|uniref:ROK family protein n=1 Tax=Planctomyces sp. SH-PL14 TaxID=1632864 RepID=UPI00078E57EE|nr:ROK family protein [Planctomyces sp. SH-PL14]AMV19002.1 Glucokinase [Planctomyces sp. SH-PL14]